MTVKSPLRILLLEDNSADAELIRNTLEADHLVSRITCVQTRAEFLTALEDSGIDLILGDSQLPSFNGISALRLALSVRPDLPFIFVSAILGEEAAVQALKIGATDYVLKTRLSRLVPAVRRALRETEERAQRKKAEAALRRSEAYLAEAQRLSHTGSFGWNVRTGEIFWSDETYRIFEFEPTTKSTVELVIGRTHPDDRELVRRAIESASIGKHALILEHRLLMPNGAVKYVHVAGNPTAGEDPESLLFVGAITEITERKRAEQKLRDQASLLDLTHDAIFVRDMNGTITYWNRGAEELYGWRPEEASGNVAQELLKTVFPVPFDQIEKELMRSGRWQGELVHTTKSGMQLTVASRWSLQRDDKASPVAIVVTNNDISERRQAEKAREEIEEQWRAAFDSNPTMYFIVDAGGVIVTVNTFGAEQLGYNVDELVGRPVLDVFYESDKEAVRKHAQDCFAQPGRMMRWEARKIRKDGTMLWVRETANAVSLKNRPVLLVVCEDITEQKRDLEDRKRAEQALRRSEAYLAESQRLTNTCSWAVEAKNRELVYWSDAMFRVFGFDPQHGFPSRERIWERIHPEDRAHVKENSDKVIRGKVDCEFEYRVVLPGGIVRHIHAIGHPVLNSSGELIEVVGTDIDVTERKQAEEALRRNQAYLAEAQRLSHTGSFAYNPKTGKTLYWSEELSRIFGLDPQRGTPDPENSRRLVHPDDRDAVSEGCLQGFRDKAPFSQEYRLLLHDGTVKHLHVLWHPVLDAAGELVEYVGTAADITERKRAEEERERLRQLEADLAHMNRVTMLGELASSLAHEINQPIAAAITSANACLRWLAHDPPDLERARAATIRIEKDGSRAAEIIQRLRAFYKKGAPPHRELVDINKVVVEMLGLLRNEATRHSIALRTELIPQLPHVMADRVQLQQVLMNLMLNGIEAMHDEGGEVMIRSQKAENGFLLISVSDSGVGLPPEKADLIFNAFYTTKRLGTGMGLAISRSIIEAHGGRLWATANAGRGATFHFTVPAEVHQ